MTGTEAANTMRSQSVWHIPEFSNSCLIACDRQSFFFKKKDRLRLNGSSDKISINPIHIKRGLKSKALQSYYPASCAISINPTRDMR